MPVPVVPFTDERLPNGLRLIISEDHLVPVVAVNVWYDVGSKHEQPGRTGFAHLFEHVMFQGSRHVAKAEHIALVQAAGGTMNGTTWLDRTNYFETMPSHQLELALWLEADRLATLLDALSQENLDNQRAVVKNEKRNSYDNQPYGTWQEKMLGHLYPPEHPYHHPTIGSMEDLDAASLEDVSAFFRTYYAPNNAVLSIVGDVDPAQARAWVERYFGPIPANPAIPPFAVDPLPMTLGGERRETVEDRVPLPRIYAAYRAPAIGDERLYALEIAAQVLAGGKGSRLHRRLVREGRIAQDVAIFLLPFASGPSVLVGWATVRPEATRGGRRGGLPRGGRAPCDGGDHRGRAAAGEGPDRDRRARVAPAGLGARRPAEHVRDPARRPGRDQPPARPLSRGDRGRRARRLRGAAGRAQPRRPHLRAGPRRDGARAPRTPAARTATARAGRSRTA